MAVNQVSGVGRPWLAAAPQPMGVSAQLAEARARVRAAAPEGSTDGVFDEVRRLQMESGMAPLAALHIVYRKLADGWVPGS